MPHKSRSFPRSGRALIAAAMTACSNPDPTGPTKSDDLVEKETPTTLHKCGKSGVPVGGAEVATLPEGCLPIVRIVTP